MTTSQSAIVRLAVPQRTAHYDILIGHNLLGAAGEPIAAALGRRSCIIVTDSNVAALHLTRLEQALLSAGHSVPTPIIVPAGEASKDFATLQRLLGYLFDRKLDRASCLIALGGGVIGDLTGFAAAIALRGVDFVQIPTTLLAQVDSSVGGKTGINSPHGKNTIGAFNQPRLVLADVDVLQSLPLRELKAGYAEVVKYGLIRDYDFFRWCEGHGAALLAGDSAAQIYAVEQSCRAKAAIVAADERESGDRALLNFGHTFGHALEATHGYGATLLHGEAVSIGMAMAFALSVRLGLCPASECDAVIAHLKALGLPTRPPAYDYDLDRLLALMAQDKKAERGRLTLILTRGIGKAFVAKAVEPTAVRELWQDYLL
jgi:3-dehydroquinate synthase